MRTATSQTLKRRIPILGVLACAGALAGVSSLAGAADAAPEPGCAGVQFTDPAGDTEVAPQAIGVPGSRAPDNYDITAGFFLVEDGQLTANLRFVAMDGTPAPGADGARYYMFFTLDDADLWVRATRRGSETVYEYGHSDGTSLVMDGATKGAMFDGKDGVVQIVVPTALKAMGKTLTNTGSESRAVRATVGTAYWTDLAPDDGNTGKSFTAAPCADSGGGGGTEPAPTEPGQTASPPASRPPPPKQAESTQPGAGPPTAGGASPAQLDLRVSVGRQSARKIGKRKRMIVTVRSAKGVRGLKATLVSGTKTVGRGKLAKVQRSAKLAIKVRRKLKAGSYTLRLEGTNATGTRAAGVVNLRIRK